MLERIARFSVSHRTVVLGLWILAIVSAGVAASRLGPRYSNEFRLPASESQRVSELLESEFPDFRGQPVQIVFRSERGVADPETRQRMEDLFSKVGELPHVAGVRSPYQGGGGISPDGHVAFGTVELDVDPTEVPREDIATLRDTIVGASQPGLQVEAGGMVIGLADLPELGRAELVGLGVAVVVLLVAFGSVLATGLPIMTAIFTLATAMSLIVGLSHVLKVPIFAPDLARMIGLGVGIDYALLVVTRFRENLHAGADPKEASVMAIKTAGRSVLFAGIIVAISLLGLFAMGLDFVNGMAISAGMAVLLAIAASLTLLPVALVTLGHGIDKLKIPVFTRDESDFRRSWSHRWSRLVQRRPWTAATLSAGVLLTLAIPALSIDLGAADVGNTPTTRTQRRAYDLLSEAFGPGFNGPVIVLVRMPEGFEAETRGLGPSTPAPGDPVAEGGAAPTGSAEAGGGGAHPIPEGMPPLPPSVREVYEGIAGLEGVVQVTPPLPAPSGSAFLMQAIPSWAPQEKETRELIHSMREYARNLSGEGGEVLVGGLTAAFVDLSDYLSERLVWLIAGVISLSFLLLTVVFRSLLVPLKAAVMNVLSIGASYGVVVAIFQWGWLKDLVGLERTGPIEPYLPMMMFAILFGLSMDYEVFLISRIREEYDRSGDANSSVADGLAATARVISAAAAIMVAVFLAFVANEQRILKLFGIGLATAIFVDATLARLVLVPATMQLLGRANWWLPSWLDRIIPTVRFEGGTEADVEKPSGSAEEPETAVDGEARSEKEDLEAKKPATRP